MVEQNNTSARAFKNFVHFLAVLIKTKLGSHQNLDDLRTETPTANNSFSNWKLNAAHIHLRYAEVEVCRFKRR